MDKKNWNQFTVYLSSLFHINNVIEQKYGFSYSFKKSITFWDVIDNKTQVL